MIFFSFKIMTFHGLWPACYISFHGLWPACYISLHGLWPACYISLHGLWPACYISFHGLWLACYISFHGLWPACYISLHLFKEYHKKSHSLFTNKIFVMGRTDTKHFFCLHSRNCSTLKL